jgi:hypothetical protein
VREDARSAIWGGATLGLIVGLVLGFFVGTYWMTVLYAVLIGAASGATANVLAWFGSSMQTRRRGNEFSSDFDEFQLKSVGEVLREHSPADFDASPNAAAECVEAVGMLEERNWWRAGYDSLESFYQAHEAEHPDIRVYAAVRGEFPTLDALEPPDGIGEAIARQVAMRRTPQSR